MSSTTQNKPTSNQTSHSTINNESKNLSSTLDTLGEDDEFEDFPIENWTEDKSDISHLILNSKSKTSNSTSMEDLWEDNWDDEVLESDFAHQLRSELEKTKASSGTGPAPMQT
ncbi:hypothetical protein DFH28DRAFT_1080108 [Melampsora americana]|nr:hypothetical protein DFH28DRAFT_1080108 [Melampsora americana]